MANKKLQTFKKETFIARSAQMTGVTVSIIAVFISVISRLSEISPTLTGKDFIIQNANLLYFVLIIDLSLTIMISFFIFFLKRSVGRNTLRQQITGAFIDAIENSSLNSNLKVKNR